MQFIHQALTWGFLIALVPLLIHLINLMRHRRVKWAAMDFLLQSHKKHRKWVWLRQLALLATRMAVIALIVAMLAQWVTRDQWFNLFGGKATHHYVLLDDSFSMSDRSGSRTAFDSANQAIGRIAAHIAEQDSRHYLTLIRFSRAADGADQPGQVERVDQVADLNAQIVDGHFDLQLEELRNSFSVTQRGTGPRQALELVRQLVDQEPDQHRVVYLVSDFRAKEWENPAELRDLLRGLEQSEAQVQLVGCVQQQRANLGIVDIRPSQDTRAAGVPLFVHVRVKNFGQQPARNIPLRVRSVYYDPEAAANSQAGRLQGKEDELPTVLLEEIGPGETVTTRVQVYFPQPGQHVVEALLPEDAVAADNRRWCVVDFPEGEPVLIVDGHPDQRNAYFLSSVFQPGQRANTGIRPDVQPAAFLRDATPEALQAFQAIYLTDVDRLDERAVENLEAYVRAGGGLGIFVGEQVQHDFYTDRLYRDGQGLLPVPLHRDDVLPAHRLEQTPDLEVTDHPVFQALLGERNPLVRLVGIDRYLKPPDDWAPPDDSTIEVLARLRNGMPLVVERKFGEGRVLAFLTTLAPEWNNWGHDPSFVVVALKMQSYLAASRRSDDDRLVGNPLDLQLDAGQYRPEVAFVAPGESPETPVVIQRPAGPPAPDSPLLAASLGRSAATGDETGRQGIYEAWSQTAEGTPEVRRYALNVEPQEGDLTLVEPQTLLARLDPVQAQFRHAEEYEYTLADQGGLNRSLLLLSLVVCLLLGEQVMAYLGSYHPARGGNR